MDSKAPTGAPGSSRRRFAVDLALTAALVVAVMTVVWRYLWLYGRSTVSGTDGLAQHYTSLFVFNQWVRGMVASPELGVPLWSWNMGLGADIIGTLAFPVIGDPFALLSLAFPMAYLEYAYTALLALRIVAAGVMAALYIRKMGAKPLPAAVGVIIYVFSSFLLIQARHPYFVNAMVFLPLLLLGVELALRDRKTWPLGIFAFLTAMANFYFFYILTIITVLYAIARYLELTVAEDRWRRLLPTAARIGGSYALGAALAAPLLLPALAAVLATARAGTKVDVGLFYPAWVYRSQIAALASGHFGAHSTLLGFGYLAWLMIPVLFMRRGAHSALKFMIAAFAVFVTVPWFGSLFNGFTFPSNRFAFAWGLFLALGVALVLSEDEPLSPRDVLVAIAAFALYAVPVAVLVRPVPPLIAGPLAVGAVTICALVADWYLAKRAARNRTEESSVKPRRLPIVLWALLGLVVLNVVVNGTLLHSRRFGDALDDFAKLGRVQQTYEKNLGSVVSELPKDGFYRVENSLPVMYNSSMVQGFPSTSFYFSTMNGYLTEFREELDSRPGWSAFSYDGFDERVMPTTLLATRYYLARAGRAARARVPYGFRLERRTPEGAVYVNEHPLPIGFVYENAINRSEYLRLDPVDRQAAMLRGVVVDDGVAPNVPRVSPTAEAVEVPYSVLSTRGAEFDRQAGRIERTRDDASIVVSIAPVTDAELYVQIRDFDNVAHPARKRPGAAVGTGTFGERFRRARQPEVLTTVYTAGLVRKAEAWRTPESPYYWGNRSQLIHLGYQTGKVTTIGIEPQGTGTLTFDSLKVLALPMKEYPGRVGALQASPLTDVEIGTNRLSGRVNARTDGLLFLSVPFTTGWSATVDGRPVALVRANTGFSAIPVSAGVHAVELRYFTPWLREGLVVGALALLGVAVAVALGVYHRRRSRA